MDELSPNELVITTQFFIVDEDGTVVSTDPQYLRDNYIER